MAHIFGGFFQLGYVTRDVDLAVAAFRERFGPVDFLINDPVSPENPSPAARRIALAWIDDMMTEIIQPDFDQPTIYDAAVPDADGAIRIHHFGYLIDDHDRMLQHMVGLGYAVPMQGSMPGFLDYSYADTRAELGVFSEFIRLDTHGRIFFDSVPRNPAR